MKSSKTTENFQINKMQIFIGLSYVFHIERVIENEIMQGKMTPALDRKFFFPGTHVLDS